MTRLNLDRRRLLKLLGFSAIAAAPVFRLGIGQSRAGGEESIPQRFVGVYHPAGWRVAPRNHWYYEANPELSDGFFFPGRVRNQSYDLADVSGPWPAATEPLREVAEHLVILEGIDNHANRGGNNHMMGLTTMLTGAVPLQNNNASGGVSLDYVHASSAPTPFSVIPLSVGVAGTLSYSGPLQAVPPDLDPARAYSRYFAPFMGNDEDAAEMLARRRIVRGSVLDHLGGELTAVLPAIPTSDRPRFDAHLDAIRSAELRIDATISNDPACVDPGTFTLNPEDNNLIPELTDAMMQLLVAALACDLSRSASFCFGRGTLAFAPTFLGLTEHYHAYSHFGFDDTSRQAEYSQLLGWTAQQVTSLIQRLEAIPTADGRTLLYHCLMMWSTDNSNGWAHTIEDTPIILAGQAGGALQGGRVVSYPSGTYHNRLLISAAQALGHDVDTFGSAEYSEGGALPGVFS